MFAKKRTLAVAALLLVAPSHIWAEEEAEADQGPWSGKIGIGYTSTSGNNDTSSFTGNAEVNWDGERWHHILLGKMLGQSTDNDTTAEAYKAAYQGKFDLTGRTYLFGLLDYNKDRFSSYDQQIFETLGIGQRILKKDKHELNGEISAGASQSDLVLLDPNTGDRIGTDSINEAVFRLGVNYTWTISENSTFSQIINVTSGSSNTFTESITELSAGIVGTLSTVLGYTIRNNSDVEPGKDKTDTFVRISLEYAF